MTDHERTRLMLEEAFRCLRRHTGLRGWEESIGSWVDAGLVSDRCRKCGGDGYIDRTGVWGDDERLDCPECDRAGYVLVPREVP